MTQFFVTAIFSGALVSPDFWSRNVIRFDFTFIYLLEQTSQSLVGKKKKQWLGVFGHLQTFKFMQLLLTTVFFTPFIIHSNFFQNSVGSVIIFPLHVDINAFFLYKRHFWKQRQAEIGKKSKQKLSNTLRLNFCYLKIFRFLHPHHHPKIIDVLKNVQETGRSI